MAQPIADIRDNGEHDVAHDDRSTTDDGRGYGPGPHLAPRPAPAPAAKRPAPWITGAVAPAPLVGHSAPPPAPAPAWVQTPVGHAAPAVAAAPSVPSAPAAVPPFPPQRPAAMPPQSAPRGPGGVGRAIVVAVIVVCLVAVGAGCTWFLLRPEPSEPGSSATSSGTVFGAPSPEQASADDDSSGQADPSAAPSATRTTDPAPTTSPVTPTASPEQQALAELTALRAASLPRLVLDGRWVAQVASKSVGTTDPLQTAANGTHTFYAADILAESRAAVSSVSPSSALVVSSTDFGKRSFAADGQPYWITLVDVGFTGSDQVKAWCAGTYPTLTAQQLANACAARTLSPPHD